MVDPGVDASFFPSSLSRVAGLMQPIRIGVGGFIIRAMAAILGHLRGREVAFFRWDNGFKITSTMVSTPTRLIISRALHSPRITPK